MKSLFPTWQKTINSKDKALLLLVLFIPCILIRQTLNNDIWFILNNGRYVIEHGIPYIEPFTIHQGLSYVMQQWLSSVIFWEAYSKLGTAGLTLIIILMYMAITWTVFSTCIRISKGNFFVSFAVTLFGSVFTGWFMVQRPFIFFILILAVEISLLEAYIDEKKIKYLMPLPVLSILLVNLQAAMWPILFVILLPYVVDSFNFKLPFLNNDIYPKKPLFLSIAVMVAAGFVNPYGLDAMTYLFRSYGYKEISNYIFEMKAPDINNPNGIMVYFAIFFVLAVYIFHKNREMKARYILLTVGTIIMTLSSTRNFSIFCICSIIPMAHYLKNVEIPEISEISGMAGSSEKSGVSGMSGLYEVQRRKPRVSGSRASLNLRSALVLMLCALTVCSVFIKYQAAVKENSETLLPQAVDYVVENADSKDMVLYTGFNTGPYAEFKGLRPYIDTRAEVFVKKNNKKEDIMKEYFMLQTGHLNYHDFIDKYSFTHLIVENTDLLYTSLASDEDYKIAFSNDDYRVFEKAD
ncbi:MAG: hypothetical protein HGA22_03530 [Clostridiales bacterium]|nr:hypothetical protein [Clostridiales bacterium]